MSKEITSVSEWWKNTPIVDRKTLLEELYINTELGQLDFFKLPTRIKNMLFNDWDSNNSYIKKEFN